MASNGTHRWVARSPRDTRPIVGISEEIMPAWVRLLEELAPVGCAVVALLVLALTAYAYGVDYLAGHL